jgi:hypothetical protein
MLMFWILAPLRLASRCQRFVKLAVSIFSQHVSSKRWHLPKSLQGVKTQNISIIIILTAVKTSNLTLGLF